MSGELEVYTIGHYFINQKLKKELITEHSYHINSSGMLHIQQVHAFIHLLREKKHDSQEKNNTRI